MDTGNRIHHLPAPEIATFGNGLLLVYGGQSFNKLKGVLSVQSGYSGGKVKADLP